MCLLSVGFGLLHQKQKVIFKDKISTQKSPYFVFDLNSLTLLPSNFSKTQFNLFLGRTFLEIENCFAKLNGVPVQKTSGDDEEKIPLDQRQDGTLE